MGASKTRLVVLAVLLLAMPAAGASAQRPPNVLVILADDQGWGDLSFNGNTNLSTPRIDALARAGAVLEHFYVCPVCAPTRAEFLTGRYYPGTGVRGVDSGRERLGLEERTIAEAFQKAGYATGAFGKWHNGAQHPYHPNARGFEEFYGFASGHSAQYFDPQLEHNGQAVQVHGYLADAITERAMAFMEANRERPFFCYVPFNTPHSPMQVPDGFYGRFASRELALRGVAGKGGENLAHTRAALAMCENIDWNTGRLLDRLEQLGLTDGTIVVYFSDNGPNGARWNGGFKGRKGSVDEGGVRSPCFIRWPGKIPAGRRVGQIAGAIDLLPTLAALAGVPLPSQKPLDGRSLQPLLTGADAAAAPWPDRLLFSVQPGRGAQVSVRSQAYRLDPAGRLYAIDRDPGQEHDLAGELPAEAERLSKAAREFAAALPAGFGGADLRPFTVGWAALTMLPAGEGEARGGVVRSAKAPNSSYFTHWTRPEDEITWQIEVAQPGEYEVVVLYACAPENAGVVLECEAGAASVRAKVTQAHDPPARGAAEDRVPRELESYLKEFRPLSLGRLALPAGRTVLRLRAPEIPGREAVELGGVELRR